MTEIKSDRTQNVLTLNTPLTPKEIPVVCLKLLAEHGVAAMWF